MMFGYEQESEKSKEKEALAALLKALAKEDSEEEEMPSSKELEIIVEAPEKTSKEVESELEEGQDIEADAEESLEEEEEEDLEGEDKPLSLKELVASFMNDSKDPLADKQGMGFGISKEKVSTEFDLPQKLKNKIIKGKRRS